MVVYMDKCIILVNHVNICLSRKTHAGGIFLYSYSHNSYVCHNTDWHFKTILTSNLFLHLRQNYHWVSRH